MIRHAAIVFIVMLGVLNLLAVFVGDDAWLVNAFGAFGSALFLIGYVRW